MQRQMFQLSLYRPKTSVCTYSIFASKLATHEDLLMYRMSFYFHGNSLLAFWVIVVKIFHAASVYVLLHIILRTYAYHTANKFVIRLYGGTEGRTINGVINWHWWTPACPQSVSYSCPVYCRCCSATIPDGLTLEPLVASPIGMGSVWALYSPDQRLAYVVLHN